MPSYDQHTKTRSVFRNSTALALGLLPLLAMGCVQQSQPIASLSTSPPNTMDITITNQGDIGDVTAGGNRVLPVSDHHVTVEKTYDFGPQSDVSNVCFWGTQASNQKYCWANNSSATISINRGGVIQGATSGGSPISSQSVNATVTKQSHSGPGSYCYWITLGSIYCF